MEKLGDSLNNNDVEENDVEEGNGGDSDNEVSEMAELEEAMAEVALNRMEAEINDEGDEDIIGSDNVFDVVHDDDKVPLERHKPPDDWVDPPPKPNTDEPPFNEVDNPGGWPSFTFRPKYMKGTGGNMRDITSQLDVHLYQRMMIRREELMDGHSIIVDRKGKTRVTFPLEMVLPLMICFQLHGRVA